MDKLARKLKFIQQYDEKDCGPTCLAMISQYYGKRVSIPRLREYAKTNKIGTNLYGLVKVYEFSFVIFTYSFGIQHCLFWLYIY